MAPKPVPSQGIVGTDICPPMASEGLDSCTRIHVWPQVMQEASAKAHDLFSGQAQENALCSISAFRSGEHSVPGAAVVYEKDEQLWQCIRRQVYYAVFTTAAKEALYTCYPKGLTGLEVSPEAALSFQRVEKYVRQAGLHIFPIQAAARCSFMGAIPYIAYALFLSGLGCNCTEDYRFDSLKGRMGDLLEKYPAFLPWAVIFPPMMPKDFEVECLFSWSALVLWLRIILSRTVVVTILKITS